MENSPENQSMLDQTQQQVNEVADIMRSNIQKVVDRGHRLSELDRRADDLQEGSKMFKEQAHKVRKKYWWKNRKMMIIMVAVGVIILFVITG